MIYGHTFPTAVLAAARDAGQHMLFTKSGLTQAPGHNRGGTGAFAFEAMVGHSRGDSRASGVLVMPQQIRGDSWASVAGAAWEEVWLYRSLAPRTLPQPRQLAAH